MAKNNTHKFYAVRIGLTPGIYTDWAECKANVIGFPGAVFKSFKDKGEAEAFMAEDEVKEKASCEAFLNLPDGYCAFVDGSYDIKTGRYSCGGVILLNRKIIETFSEVGNNKENASMRNVAGEILGAQRAVEYCLKHEISDIIIFHDYQGVGSWADGYWQANRSATKKYAKFVNEARRQCNIKFKKVKGHSDNRYNDMADELAKQALGIPTTSKKEEF